MARKKKGELPSGNIRRQVFIGYEYLYDASGRPILDEKGRHKKKRKYASVTAATSAQAELNKAEIKIHKEHLKTPINMTLRDAIKDYIQTSDAVLSPTTIAGYKTILDYAFIDIMDKKITSITNEILRESVNKEAKRGKTRYKKYVPISPKTVANEYGLIVAVIRHYTQNTFNVKLPQKENKIKELPAPEEVFHAVRGTKIELAVLLAMWLSFSMSEVRGLTKSKSIHGDYITIVEVTVKVNGKDVTKKQAKKESRNRKHRIPEYIKALIDNVETDVLVPQSSAYISYHFKKQISSAGLPYMTFHDLRHMNASIMSMLRIPEKYAMERGGWSSDHVMKKVYTHTFSEQRAAVDDKIDTFFYDNVIGASKMDADTLNKYKSWLILFDKEDTKQNKKDFYAFINMQHEMQHK